MRRFSHLFLVAFLASFVLTGFLSPVSAQYYHFQTGFPADYVVDSDAPGEGWVGVRTFGVSATSFKDLPNSGIIEGDGALKFLSFKDGVFPSLTSPAYENLKLISFYCYFQNNNKDNPTYPIAGTVIIEKVVGEDTTQIGIITEENVSADASEWTLLSFDVNETEATSIIIRSVTEDADLRVWFDDLSVESSVALAIDRADVEVSLSTYPNPASDQLTVDLNGFKANQISLFSASGQLVKTIQNPSRVSTIDLKDCSKGLYIVKADGQTGVAIKKVIIK